MVDFLDQAFITQSDRIGRDHVDQVPAYVAGFRLRANFGGGLRRRIIINDIDVRVALHIRFMVCQLLGLGVGATPGNDHKVLG